MKTIVCGPPHSGKSVFISNLIHLLPSGAYKRINANGDGEGTWSNNPNQNEVLAVRDKGTNTPNDFKCWKQQIDAASQDIVLVDIGGLLQEDKIPLFKACDSFIVISKDEQKIKEWYAFGTKQGCRCIGTILSKQGDLVEEIQSREPYLQCVMSGFERGHDLNGSRVLASMAETIVSLSGHKGGYQKFGDSNVIDLYDIGIKLGMSTRQTSSDVETVNVWYNPNISKNLYDYLTTYYCKGEHYKIYGARALWVACLVFSCLSNEAANNLEIFGQTSQRFFPIGKWPVGAFIKGKLTLTVKEEDDYVLLDIKLPTKFFPNEGDEEVLPLLDSTKKLLISGRMPAWVAASIVLSYDNDQIYMFAPGIGFIKVVDKVTHQYGEVIHPKIAEKNNANP